MLQKIASFLGGGIVKEISQAIDDHTLSKEEKLDAITALFNKELEASARVIEAEAKSDGRLARNWRPITMLVFVAIIANNYILYPYLSLIFEGAPILEIPPDMWALLKIGLGGYVVGRSGEKVAKLLKQ